MRIFASPENGSSHRGPLSQKTALATVGLHQPPWDSTKRVGPTSSATGATASSQQTLRKEAIEAGRRRANDSDHYHTVANPAKGEKPGERGAGPVKPTGYRPGQKSARRQDKKYKQKGRGPGPRP